MKIGNYNFSREQHVIVNEKLRMYVNKLFKNAIIRELQVWNGYLHLMVNLNVNYNTQKTISQVEKEAISQFIKDFNTFLGIEFDMWANSSLEHFNDISRGLSGLRIYLTLKFDEEKLVELLSFGKML